MRTLCLALACAATLSFPLSAQTARKRTAPPPATVNMDLAVTDAVRTVLAGQFDEGHIAMPQALGHQQAVAATCPGFAIDPRAFANAFDLIYDGADGKPRSLSGAQRTEIERKATLGLGMTFGGQIAISANDHTAFCRAATQERAGGKAAHLVWAK
jgi:hypothetical protein